jgi:hypothetical protein
MSSVPHGAAFVRRLGLARDNAAVLWVFSATLFLSALLLFSVQPIFAKIVLPKLGGSPSVWAVSMCFFQAVLLAGYCYAHALNRLLAPALAPLVHLMLLGAAVLALPFGLPAFGDTPPAGDAYLWLVAVLAVGVGLPFFAVSANAPLLQAWFARTGHPHAADPYFLYGASNLGSLIALLAYPVAIEPVLGLAGQAGLWTRGFILLGFLIAVSGLVMYARIDASAGASDAAPVAPAAPLVWRQRLAWIGLAFVPSGLLVAFTSYVSTDIASAPFLWVLPLAVFLLTFILVFRERPVFPHVWLVRLQPALVGLVLFGISSSGPAAWLIANICGAAVFFVTTMVCHKELFDRRPESRHLTEFYLWMSAGGVLGGIFAAIIAPQIFNSIYEFPLLLVLGVACRPGALARDKDEAGLWRIVGVGLLVMAALAVAIRLEIAPPVNAWRVLMLTGFGVLAVLAVERAHRQLAYVAVMALSLAVLPSSMNRGDAERSFFGVHRVSTIEQGRVRVLMHGTTIHGAERIRNADGTPVERPVPMAYYYPGAPMTRGVEVARIATGRSGPGFRAGVVGLGAGVMACNSKAGETWRFFEIDPVVIKIARDPKQFTFLSTCLPSNDVVVGDARLTLAGERAQSFDFLLIDAFASDAIPVHLMTREAISLYLDKLTPNGVLALHVSNRHLDLYTVASATAKSLPGTFVGLADDRIRDKGVDRAGSHVVFVTRSAEAFRAVSALPYVTEITAPAVTPWTDDYSDIVTALWRQARNGN